MMYAVRFPVLVHSAGVEKPEDSQDTWNTLGARGAPGWCNDSIRAATEQFSPRYLFDSSCSVIIIWLWMIIAHHQRKIILFREQPEVEKKIPFQPIELC